MKQFLLFCGEDYYAHGGWDDFAGDFDTLAAAAMMLEAKAAKSKPHDQFEWAQIVDTETMKVAWVGRPFSETPYYKSNPGLHTEGHKFMWWPEVEPEIG